MTSIQKHPFLLAGAASLLTLLALPLFGGAVAVAASTSATGSHASGGSLSASPTTLAFPATTLGDYTTLSATLTNNGTATDSVSTLTFGGANPDDFALAGQNTCTSVAVGASCTVQVEFAPGAIGARQATLTPVDGSANPPVITLQGTGSEGYYEATASGAVTAHGDAAPFGDESGTHLTQPIVGIASTGDNGGYWLVASDGGVFTFGDAGYYGSTGAMRLNKPIVGMAPYTDSDGQVTGYWLVASDGGVFTFGGASYYGSTGNIHLNKPIVGMAATPDGGGYWLVASDGGIFTFGDAPFENSSAGTSASPFIGIAGDGAPFF